MWLLALIADVALYTLMVQFGRAVCGSAGCYHFEIGTDQIVDYLALATAVMAVFIPIAIEIWRQQFATHNLAKRTPLDDEWVRENRLRYLHEPVGNLVVFLFGTCILPLFSRHTALFYADLIFGLWLLGYVIWVSFYKKPIYVYDLKALRPAGTALPERDIMGELVTATIASSDAKSDGTSVAESRPWTLQLDEDSTLKQLLSWAMTALTEDKKSGVARHTFWVILYNFLRKCDAITLWASWNDGGLKKLFADKRFYAGGNLVHATQVVRVVIERFTTEDNYDEAVREVLLAIPLSKVQDGRIGQLLMPGMRALFFKAGDSSYVLKDAIPAEWRVTVASVDERPVITKTVANLFLFWVRDLWAYANEINEQAVQATVEDLFPDVETILFAKFVILWVYSGYLADPNPNFAVFKEGLGRWRLFGHVSRVGAEWTPVGSEQEAEKQYAEKTAAQEDQTVALLKKLGWISDDPEQLRATANKIKTAVGEDNISWNHFADRLIEMADSDAKAKD